MDVEKIKEIIKEKFKVEIEDYELEVISCHPSADVNAETVLHGLVHDLANADKTETYHFRYHDEPVSIVRVLIDDREYFVVADSDNVIILAPE